LEVLSWISDQLTKLAEAFAEPLTEERVVLYAQGLADISMDRLKVSFERALRELTWFPKIAELRRLATCSPEDEKKVEADAAWNYVNEYLREWGADLFPIYSSGKTITPPPLDSRSEYALRRIGGLRSLNLLENERRPFMYRDFCEAYAQAPVAELMAPTLLKQFGQQNLSGTVKQLTEAKTMECKNPEVNKKSHVGRVRQEEELTTERKAELRRMIDEEMAKRKTY